MSGGLERLMLSGRWIGVGEEERCTFSIIVESIASRPGAVGSV